MSDDDDLPVLTQVLRTGNRRVPPIARPAAIERREQPLEPAESSRLDLSRPDHAPARSTHDEPLLTDALVIGQAPRSLVEPYLTAPPVSQDDATSLDPGTRFGDDRAVHDGGDQFRLPHDQDHESGPTAAFIRTIVEPEVEPEVELVARSPAEPVARRDPALDPALDPTFGARIRDAVVEDLLTRIDTEFDARIAHVLHVEIETAVAQLQGRLRTHLAEAMRDVVGRAVDEELARRGDAKV